MATINMTVKTTTNLHLRQTPDVRFAPLALIPRGFTLTVIRSTGAWYQVNFDNKVGFIAAKFTEVIADQNDSSRNNVFTEVKYLTNKVTVGKNGKQLVVFHHSAGNFQSTINTIINSEKQAGYHCLINLNGDRAVFNNLDSILWHAGKSEWQGRRFCNSFSIGVCFTGDTTKRSLNAKELQSLVEWIEPHWHANRWTLQQCTTHRHIAVPRGRKIDVSESAERQIMDALQAKFGR